MLLRVSKHDDILDVKVGRCRFDQQSAIKLMAKDKAIILDTE